MTNNTTSSTNPISNFYRASAADFKKIPGSPIAYWVSDRVRETFKKAKILESLAEVKHGLSTGKNEAVVRLWSEISYYDFGLNIGSREEALNSGFKWFPYNKGGDFRKWYGNCEFVLRYDKYGNDLMATFSGHRHDGKSHYFMEGVTWTFISSSKFAARYSPIGFVFDVSGSSLFISNPKRITLYGLVFQHIKGTESNIKFSGWKLKNSPYFRNTNRREKGYY
ncbi:MAG TPA: hypothetical protein PKE52_11695 [Bacteroidales bacterium]|nr:hypothetical protein [Bacteroidales bacterium]